MTKFKICPNQKHLWMKNQMADTMKLVSLFRKCEKKEGFHHFLLFLKYFPKLFSPGLKSLEKL